MTEWRGRRRPRPLTLTFVTTIRGVLCKSPPAIRSTRRRHTMKKLALFFVLALVAIAAIAQEHPALTAQANSVYVGADGKFEADPDTAVLTFNISPQEET